MINFSWFDWVINNQAYLYRLLPSSDSLQQENGFYLLQENGDRILL